MPTRTKAPPSTTPSAPSSSGTRVSRATSCRRPRARPPFPTSTPDDTARWGLRVDYVLPSTGLTILDGGIDRPDDPNAPLSDHFLVWLDLALPGTGGG